MKLRFYLDENVPVQVAQQLRARGIDAVTARSEGMLGATDDMHLQQAARLGRVLCTNDADFLRLATAGIKHVGIVFGQQDSHYIGDWVRFLALLHTLYADEEMVGRVEFL